MEISGEQLVAAFERVPRPIREFLIDDAFASVASELTRKYQLHLDSAGSVSTVIRNTLLGFVRPNELPQMLMDELMLDESMANRIIKDINEMVFVPLQQKVREATAEETEEEEDETPIVPAPTPSVQPMNLDYEPPPPAPQVLPGSSAPVPVAEPSPEPQPVQEVPPASPVPPSPAPEPRTTIQPTPPTAVKGYGADPYREPI